MTTFIIDQLNTNYQQEAEQFVLNHWGSIEMVSRGILYQVLEYDGFVALVDDAIQGIIAYRMDAPQCEILLLQSSIEGIGIGAALIEHVKQAALNAACNRLWLITTNDNIPAFRWYQKQGFTLATVHINTLAESRKLKPQIPLTGYDGIPLRDEIEFEMLLRP